MSSGTTCRPEREIVHGGQRWKIRLNRGKGGGSAEGGDKRRSGQTCYEYLQCDEGGREENLAECRAQR